MPRITKGRPESRDLGMGGWGGGWVGGWVGWIEEEDNSGETCLESQRAGLNRGTWGWVGGWDRGGGRWNEVLWVMGGWAGGWVGGWDVRFVRDSDFY